MTALPRIRIVLATASFALLAACGGEKAAEPDQAGTDATAVASGDEPAVIKERQDNYEAIGDAFKAIRGQMESGSPDFAAIGNSAADINERAKRIPTYFPEGTGVDAGYDTEALATIWEKPAEFQTAAQNLVDASAELSGVAVTGDASAVGEAVKKLGGTCKACHDQFRVKKN